MNLLDGLIPENEKMLEKIVWLTRKYVWRPPGARIPVVKDEINLILLISSVIYEFYDKKESIRLFLNEVLGCIYLF